MIEIQIVNIWKEIQETGAGIEVDLTPRALAEAISRILADKGLAGEMGTQGRLAAEERYSWPRIVKQLTQIYRKLIEEETSKQRYRM